MTISGLLDTFATFIFSNTHCDVLEQKSAQLVKQAKDLQIQAEEDAKLFLEEEKQLANARIHLSELFENAKAIQQCANRSLANVLAFEEKYKQQTKALHQKVILTLMPDKVPELKKDMVHNLGTLEQAMNQFRQMSELLKTRGIRCNF